MELHHKLCTGLLVVIGVFAGSVSLSQTTTQNYVRVRVSRKPIATVARLDQLTANKDSVMTTIQYMDGLGRPLQTVQRQASTGGNDIIQPMAYDAYGREALKYLPYINTATNYGAYRSDALSPTSGVMQYYNPTGATVDGKQSNGIVQTPYPYAQSGFEASPLNRIIEQGAPGKAWQIGAVPDANSGKHSVRTIWTANDYSVFGTSITANDGSRKAALYTAGINADGSRSLLRKGDTARYLPGKLSVTIARDENWIPTDKCFGTTEEYKDLAGRVVLKRTYNINAGIAEMLSTYYVYDERGNLCFVLPPGAAADATVTVNQGTLNNFCYQYRYDSRNRLYAKKIPGKGWEFIIYNKLDQVAATQDSVQRMKAMQEWTVTKYDALGRPVLKGIYPYGTAGADNHVAIQTAADAVATLWETTISTGTGYTSNAWPATGITTVLNITYYDTYANIPGLPSQYNQQSNALYSKKITGLVTATKTLVLNTTADYLWTVPYYDEEGQVSRTFTQHYLGGGSSLSQYNYDDVQPTYNFNKQPLTITRYHNVKNSGGTAQVLALTSTDVYTYDHMGRKLKSSNTLKDGVNTAQQQVLVAKNIYNELGQLKQKGLHSINGTSFLQNVDYRYNARGWLTNINNGGLTNDQYTSTDLNDQFGMDLKYDDASTPQYNGNIGSAKTLTGAISGTSYLALTYNYKYDKLNRLVNAISSTATETANDNFYNENVTYDVMGNIQKLNRYDKPFTTRTAIDSLTYTYVSGSKIDRVDDLGTTAGFNNTVSQAGEYTYDGNGNQLVDLNKGLTQAYNMLNLPQTAVKSGISVAYIYDATGRKLRKLSTTVSATTVTEYVNGIQYEYTGTNPKISFIQTEEGRARKNGTVYKYEYDLKDHLGNTRLTTTWALADSVNQLTPLNLQRNDYYAFGYTIQSLQGTMPSSPNHYLYNHKELQDETGLYDYSARFYDPVIGRWTSVDPLAEKMRRYSPYNYGFDDPVRFTDPDGMGPTSVHVNEFGDVLKNVKDGDNGVYEHDGKTAKDVNKDYSAKNTSAGGKKIGTLGGKINANNIIKNISKRNGAEAKSGTATDWYNNVKKDGKWDYKDNNNTVFGVAWQYDEAHPQNDKTSFSFGDSQMNAADFGNLNAGFTGNMAGIPEIAQKLGAGVVEKLKNGGKDFVSYLDLTNPTIMLNAPYGDRSTDYKYNTAGMNKATQESNGSQTPFWMKPLWNIWKQ